MHAPADVRPRLEVVSEQRLAGVSEIAELLGVSKNTALRYSPRDEFAPR